MENTELETATIFLISETVEYLPKNISNKTIVRKPTGNIVASSFCAGAKLAGKAVPFDTFIQIIEGSVELDIKGKNYNLKLGEGIIIPAHTRHNFNALQKFKMLSTVIKSGYED